VRELSVRKVEEKESKGENEHCDVCSSLFIQILQRSQMQNAVSSWRTYSRPCFAVGATDDMNELPFKREIIRKTVLDSQEYFLLLDFEPTSNTTRFPFLHRSSNLCLDLRRALSIRSFDDFE